MKEGRILPHWIDNPLSRPLIMGAILAAVGLALPAPAAGVIDYPSYPDWESTPGGQVATGAALRDLDGDGWPDLIIANGNDIYRQKVAVYRNQGGSFPLTPTWESNDVDYHGHLDLADVNGDGYLDLAVGVYLGPGGFGDRGYVKLYQGNGDGTFSSTPVWQSQDDFCCFSVAFGDIDMDGRPDLACAAGESYYGDKDRYRVYRNVDGVLGGLPYWTSDAPRYSLDVTWGDVNGDGILDLVVGGTSNPGDPDPFPTVLYHGNGTTLSTSPDWSNQDGDDYANTICLADVDGDGWLDLAICDNNQQGGSGRLKLFRNDGAGNLPATPDWVSNFGGYGSHVSFADVDFDGDLDMASGSWWGRVRIYENLGGTYPLNPTWQSSQTSVVENIAWEDVDNDGLRSPMQERFPGDGVRKHFVLPDRPVRPLAVHLDGVLLPEGAYFLQTELGWISLGQAPAAGSELRVEYQASADLDFAVSNWDTGKGNYLFLNRLDVTGIEGELEGDLALSLSPNPSPGDCLIRLSSPPDGPFRVELFNTQGRRVRSLEDHSRSGQVHWDGLDGRGRPVPAGTYWVRVLGSRETAGARLVVVR